METSGWYSSYSTVVDCNRREEAEFQHHTTAHSEHTQNTKSDHVTMFSFQEVRLLANQLQEVQ